MINKELVTSIPNITVEKETCASCLLGKQTRQPFPQTTQYQASHPLELINGDLCGPITLANRGHKLYVFVLIDDFADIMWTVLLREKSEAFESFKRFKVMVEQETKVVIHTLRTDRGGEFTSHNFEAYCERNGIRRDFTSPCSPQ